MIRLVRANLAAVLAFVDAWQPANTPRRTMQDAVNELNAYEAEHETLPDPADELTSLAEEMGLYEEPPQFTWMCSGCGRRSSSAIAASAQFADGSFCSARCASVADLLLLDASSLKEGPQSSPNPHGDVSRPVAASAETSDGAVSVPPTPAPSHLNFVDWATPAICDVLASHEAYDYAGGIECQHDSGFPASLSDWESWREHVAPLIAQRLEAAGAQHTPK